MAQTSDILERLRVTSQYIELTFKLSPQVSSLTNDGFTLYWITNQDDVPNPPENVDFADLEAATPSGDLTYQGIVPDFQTIQTHNHYNSISRKLTLFFDDYESLDTGWYALGIDGVDQANGSSFAPEAVIYSYNQEAVAPPPEGTTPTEFTILDMSIKSQAFVTDGIDAANPQFHIISTTPGESELFVDEDLNNGLISITFSDDMDEDFATPEYFKVQRKKFNAIGRWEILYPEFISVHSDPATPDSTPSIDTVYIQMEPNIDEDDATPSYLNFFEEAYKYRVRISRNIESISGEILLEDQELLFATMVDPLYVDPEEFRVYYTEANDVEIMELVHRFSNEVEYHFKGEDPTFIAIEYIRAAVLCALARIYDYSGGGDESGLTLGDLKVTSSSAVSRGGITRANAATWCELAAALRGEMLRVISNMKAVVKGTRYKNPMPERHLKSYYGGNSRGRRNV